MKALIFNNTISQVVKDDDTFEVHPEMIWVDCPEGVTVDWKYSNGVFSEPSEVELSYEMHRRFNYPPIQEQLDILYHEGYDGWKAVIQAVKDKYPKE